MLVGLSLPAPPPGPALVPRKDGIGLESLRIRFAALLFENARLTWVPPAKTGGAVGAGLAELDMMLVDEEEDEEGRDAWVDDDTSFERALLLLPSILLSLLELTVLA